MGGLSVGDWDMVIADCRLPIADLMTEFSFGIHLDTSARFRWTLAT